VDRGKAMADGQRGNQLAMHSGRGIREHYQASIRLRCERLDAALDISTFASADYGEPHAEQSRGSFDGIDVCNVRIVLWVENNRYFGNAGGNLLQHLDELARDCFVIRESGH